MIAFFIDSNLRWDFISFDLLVRLESEQAPEWTFDYRSIVNCYYGDVRAFIQWSLWTRTKCRSPATNFRGEEWLHTPAPVESWKSLCNRRSESMIPLVNQSSSLPALHSARMLLIAGRIPVFFDYKLWSEPHKMEDVLHVLHLQGFSPWFVIKNWNSTRNELHARARTVQNWRRRTSVD